MQKLGVFKRVINEFLSLGLKNLPGRLNQQSSQSVRGYNFTA